MKKLLKITAIIITLIVTSSCNNSKKNNPNPTSSKTKNTLKEEKTREMNILFVLTSHDKLGNTDKKTGFWVEEFANPYYALIDKGATITIATPKGGAAPIDPSSKDASATTKDTERFNKDKVVQAKISNTKVLATINADDFDAVFYPGGHGPLWDLATDSISISLIEKFNNQHKPIAFVCHAPAVLKEVKNSDGNFLVNGKKVTGFTNTEEEAIGLTNVVPFLVEDMLTKNGGIYSKGENWKPYAIKDGNLITGQNPASSELVAQKLITSLTK